MRKDIHPLHLDCAIFQNCNDLTALMYPARDQIDIVFDRRRFGDGWMMTDGLKRRSEATMDIACKVLDLAKRLEDPSLSAEAQREISIRIDAYKAMLAPTKDLWKT